MSAPLHVCLDARLTPGKAGGVEQYVIALARALAALPRENERYSLLVDEESRAWARERIGENFPLLLAAPRRGGKLGREARRLRAQALGLLARGPGLARLGELTLPASDGVIERAGVDVMHFTMQSAFRTRVPSIYQPHDLQHLHAPGFFSPKIIKERELAYRAFCRRARSIAVLSQWVRRDLVDRYGLPTAKIFVPSYPPPLAGYEEPTPEDLAAARRELSLPERFAFFAAQTWPHKNHAALLRSLARLRDERGIIVPLVCSGRTNEHFAALEKTIAEHRLHDQVRFLGFVSPLRIRCLYRLARLCVVPSLFEPGNFGIWEAFIEGVPVACSKIPTLASQAGDAAELFDPKDEADIARALGLLWESAERRAGLIARGRARVAPMTPERSARAFRALYRHTAGRSLSDEDRGLLFGPPPM